MKSSSRILALLIAIWVGITALAFPAAAQTDPLPSWIDGASKQAILDFVAPVSAEGGPDYVAPAERIATFDNDGTLWAEQPLYFQVLFAIDRAKALAPLHPEWKDKEPFASLLKGDVEGALAGGEHAIVELVNATHTGVTVEEFDYLVKDWLATTRHPKTQRRYTEMVYQPMLELLAFLRSSGFKTFIVTGGGIEFVRAFAEDTYSVPPDHRPFSGAHSNKGSIFNAV